MKIFKTMQDTWKDMSFRDKSAIASAWVAFMLGWAITVAGFCVPPLGTIADGVLWVMGQSLIYAASCFGIVSYFHTSLKKNKKEIASFIAEQIQSVTGSTTDEKNIEKELV